MKYKEEATELKSIISGELPAGWEKALPVSSHCNFLRLFYVLSEHFSVDSAIRYIPVEISGGSWSLTLT